MSLQTQMQCARVPCTWLLAAFALIALPTARVQAFSDPSSFSKAANEGGGGGRYFSGSPLDGYTCSVCHRGGTAPEVNVSGVPLNGYTPGMAYEIKVDWPDALENV